MTCMTKIHHHLPSGTVGDKRKLASTRRTMQAPRSDCALPNMVVSKYITVFGMLRLTSLDHGTPGGHHLRHVESHTTWFPNLAYGYGVLHTRRPNVWCALICLTPLLTSTCHQQVPQMLDKSNCQCYQDVGITGRLAGSRVKGAPLETIQLRAICLVSPF